MASNKPTRKSTRKPTRKTARKAAKHPTPAARRAPKAAPKKVAPKKVSGSKIERVEIELPRRARSLAPEKMKECGETLSRLSGGHPVVFTFEDRVVAIATSMIDKRKGHAGGMGGTHPKVKVPSDMQRQWLRQGVDLQRAVDRARAITQLKKTRAVLVRQGRYAEANIIASAISAEKRGIDTRDWALPLFSEEAPSTPRYAGRAGGAERAVSVRVHIIDHHHVIHRTLAESEGRRQFKFGQLRPSRYRAEQDFDDILDQIKSALVKQGLASVEDEGFYVHGLGYLDDPSDIILNVVSERSERSGLIDATDFTVMVKIPESALWSTGEAKGRGRRRR